MTKSEKPWNLSGLSRSRLLSFSCGSGCLSESCKLGSLPYVAFRITLTEEKKEMETADRLLTAPSLKPHTLLDPLARISHVTVTCPQGTLRNWGERGERVELFLQLAEFPRTFDSLLCFSVLSISSFRTEFQIPSSSQTFNGSLTALPCLHSYFPPFAIARRHLSLESWKTSGRVNWKLK